MNYLQALNEFLFSSEKRVSLQFLVPTLLFCLVYALFINGFSLRKTLKYVFHPKIWFSSHIRTDLFLVLFNTAFKLFLIVPFFYSALELTIQTKRFLSHLFPTFVPFEAKPLTVAVLLTIAIFLVGDFSRFLVHYTFHRFDFLWQLHKVHHNTQRLNPLTVYRVHPIESGLNLIRQTLVAGLVSGIFVFLFFGRIEAITLMGINVLGFLFNFFLANLRHSHVPISFGPLEQIFISPRMHQIHHSRKIEENMSNYGSTLACWDILFNSHKTTKSINNKPLRFGLPKSEWKTNNHFIANLTFPFISIYQNLFRKKT